MLRLDLTNLHANRIGPDAGFALERELAAEEPHLRQAVQDIRARRGTDDAMVGWIDLPTNQGALVDEITTFSQAASDRFDDLIVLGIGGSALGTLAVVQALGHAGPSRGGARQNGLRIHVVDNVDGDALHELLEDLDPRRTLVNVISKSGTTAETMAAFLIVEAWLRDALGDATRDHVVATTDPQHGVLRPYAEANQLRTFSVPPSVGGRFSVLSPVGLLPVALAGIDVRALLEGAARIDADLDAPLEDSVTLRSAAVDVMTARRGYAMHVLMPYSTKLRRLSDWFVQLWAESLGKAHDRDGREVHAGTTPIPASGTTDQHAQVQLFNEGPNDKVVTFVQVDTPAHSVPLPTPGAGLDALAYLAGHDMHDLLTAERAATAHALAMNRRPNVTLHLPRLDAHHLGALLQSFMWRTALVGERWNVDSFNQPGVELGKVYTYALMGRDGFDEERRALLDAGVAAASSERS